MSGKTVAAKIDKSMKKVSAKLGFKCQQFRPDNYTDPLDARNIIDESIVLAWSVDESYVKNPVDELDHYIVYVDSNKIQQGDIFVCASPPATIVITDIEPIRIPSGVKAVERMNIYRSLPTPQLDVKISLVKIAEQVPAAIKIVGAQNVSLTNVATGSGTTQIEVWTWMPAGDVELGDVIEWRGQRFALSSVSSTGKGTQIKATNMKKGS